MDTKGHQQNSKELQEQLLALTEENLQLREKNEHLFAKVGYLERRQDHLASSNTDLSCRFVQSEEEKLKLSKELVEEKIQTNKIRDQFEEETFKLNNKILNQDQVTTKLEMERDKLLRELRSAEARLKVGEKDGRDMTEEYGSLKKNYLVLAESHDKQLALGEELSAELLSLAQAQDALRRQLEEQQHSVNTTTHGLHRELDRVRALISRMSSNRVKLEDLAALEKEQKTMGKTLLGNHDEIKYMLEQMKNSYEEQQKKLEEKVMAMGKEQQEDKRVIRNSRHQLSKQSVTLMFSQSQVKEAEEQNSKLQFQVKELNEEYRSRLVRYLRDLAVYFDGLGEGQSPSESPKMRLFVDSMLQDVGSSYRVREEQLASNARFYKKRLHKITNTHQALLIAYRVQREQILAKSDNGLDPGLPEDQFSLEPTELRDETEKDLRHINPDRAGLEGQLQAAPPGQVSALKMPIQSVSHQESEQICEEFCPDIKKQLREITHSTLLGLEKERALLITRATVAEAQVAELHDFIDNHLGRYKEEISHLFRLHWTQEEGHSQRAHSSLH